MFQEIVAFIVGSFRLLLFLGSLIMVVISIALAISIDRANSFYSELGATDWQRYLTTLFIFAIYLVLLSLAGSFGAICNNKQVIQLFGLLLVINIMVCILAVVFLPSKNDSENNFETRLNRSLSLYNWTADQEAEGVKLASIGEPSPITSQEATRLWDKLQHGSGCCGLFSYHDWQPYAPMSDSYPKSCCTNPTILSGSKLATCDTTAVEQTNKMGCRSVLYAPQLRMIVYFWGALLFSLPLSIVAAASKGPIATIPSRLGTNWAPSGK